MAKQVQTLDALGGLLDRKASVNESLLLDLSTPGISPKRKQAAEKELSTKIETSLGLVKKLDYPTKKDLEMFKDYCRNFAAFLLVTEEEKNPKFREVFLKLVELLIILAPSFKTELRALRNAYKTDGSYISRLGFAWDDLKLPFIADRFANTFLMTEVSRKEAAEIPEPKVVVVEKPTVIEKEKIVEIEKEKIVYVPVETAPARDPNYFGKEGQTVEFKASLINSCNEKQQIWNICKAICAFLNADGGTVYIGVHDYGHAIPARQNGHLTGIHEDIAYLKSAHRLPYGKDDEDSYCLHIKYAVINKFREGNDVSKFSSDIIVSETDNDNVVKIEVRPSRYCVVFLEGVAYMRAGASSPEMDATQIEQRTQDLMSISRAALYKTELERAIREKKQAVLYSYKSANSGTVSNRYVEPVHFVCSDESIICFDTVKQATRQFRLSRIGDVKVLDTPWAYEDLHEERQIDVFGWTGHDESYDICLDMEMPAMTSLMEHHPNVTKDCFQKLGGGVWRLETKVFSLDPVVGFYLGLADKIVIQYTKDSEMLKKKIRDFVEEHVISKF